MYSAHTLVDRSGLEARFARAARHSRLVRLLRVSIPAIVATALAGIVLLSLYNPFRVAANVSTDADNIVVSGNQITMESPHMTGFSTDLRPYEIWGKSATQDTADPDNVALIEPRGKMLLEDGSTMTVESRTGRFNNKTQQLDLYKEVYVQTTNGNEAWLNHAQVDLATGGVASDDGVDVKFDGGKVKADKLRLMNRGEVVRFDGHVVMDLDHVETPSSSSTPTAAAEPPHPAVKARMTNGTGSKTK